jgi:hypothetical protein
MQRMNMGNLLRGAIKRDETDRMIQDIRARNGLNTPVEPEVENVPVLTSLAVENDNVEEEDNE